MLITRKVKLICSKEQEAGLEKTATLFKEAFNFLCAKAWNMQDACSRYKLHYMAYKEAREKFPTLPAQYIITAIQKASAAVNACKLKRKKRIAENKKRTKAGKTLKRGVSCPRMKKPSVLVLDLRLIILGEDFAKITIATGRNVYQLKMYSYIEEVWQYRHTGCEIKKYNNDWYVCMCFELPEPKLQKGKVLGVDRGVNNIAVCSNNVFYNSKWLKAVKGKYQYNRNVLQSKGTKSAKRRLKVSSGKEKRFVRDINHCISKELVNSGYATIALEKLDLRAEKKLGKSFNKKIGNWSWSMLESFVKYKGAIKGVRVINVPSFYTSQACSKCGHVQKTNRLGAKFLCKNCGFELHSDLNAARNIAKIASEGKPLQSRLLSIRQTELTKVNSNVVALRS